MNEIDIRDAQRRIAMDFTTWPTLNLSFNQVRKLWDLPVDVCEAVLGRLIDRRFLCHANGIYVRRGLGRRRYGIR